VSVKNLLASVHARLQNRARATKRPFQELLQYYAMERFLYRLSKTPHRGHLDNSLENLERVVREVCAAVVAGFGLLTRRRLQWFTEAGAKVGELTTRGPIRAIHAADGRAVVQTRQHQVDVQGLAI
jgi:hypothetical protein